jgi:hypothetical protein
MNLSTEELRAAVLIARAAALNAEVAGMQAENQHRKNCGLAVAYTEEAFQKAIAANGLGENGVISVAVHGESG